MIKALDARAITVTQIPAVLAEYRKPRHVEFEDRTAWSWFNCVTETLKEVSLLALMEKFVIVWSEVRASA